MTSLKVTPKQRQDDVIVMTAGIDNAGRQGS
jgi:hypothetical protein